MSKNVVGGRIQAKGLKTLHLVDMGDFEAHKSRKFALKTIK
jgi:hypothetical protein